MISRSIQSSIDKSFQLGKIAVVLGARQVGKTTLTSIMAEGYSKVLHLNCDDPHDAALISHRSPGELRQLLKEHDLVIIDEAQRVADIGLTLKMIGDLKLAAHVIVTGSSSLDLASGISEPATGRVLQYHLYPFSLSELAGATSHHEEQKMLERRMVYGMYPDVVNEPSFGRELLMNISNDYLYKDLLSLKGLRKPELLQKLVRALALQIGAEVSYNELAQLLGVDKSTVETYINLLEKCFVVFRLDSFSRNRRNEIKKGKKVYFYDNGIRNAVISNFAPLELRADGVALWENLMVSERMKRNEYARTYAQLYFWRNTDQAEIDLIEEADGRLSAFEFKSADKPSKRNLMPRQFAQSYPGTPFSVITPANFWSYVD